MVIARSPRKPNAASKKSSSPPAGKSRRKTERKVISTKRPLKEIPKTGHESGLIRLNKYIASTGVCSRREADEFIRAGLVTVNGKLVTEMGVKVSPEDLVKYNGETLREEKKVYILMNKPKDYITTVEDPHAKKTVLELIKGACKERVYPVGRLDRNTTGVLLLTNDGELTKRLTHPKFEKLKIYHVHLNKNLKHGDMDKIASGISLEDGFIKADSINYADPADKSQVGIEIHSGRNHIVRRIFESLGYEVAKLDRVYFAGLTKKNLHRGEWRFLSVKEITMLKMNAFK
jgi:23S rRNA pseudouridine2605 synthase